MREFIRKNIAGTKIITLFVVTSCIYSIMVFMTIPRVMSFAGGMALFDLMPGGYSVKYANSLLAALGRDGRDAYLYTQLPFDMLYPGLFGITYCLILAYVLVQLGKFDSMLFWLCLLPVGGGMFDYLENFGIIAMLTTYPAAPPIITQVASTFTVLKSSFTTVYFIVLVMSLLTLGVKKLFTKRD
jgi:hypothetical protein